MIALIDYGAGNLTSVKKALAAIGADVRVPQQPDDLASAHGIIILSLDHGSGWVWLPGRKEPVAAGTISVIGKPLGVFEKGVRR